MLGFLFWSLLGEPQTLRPRELPPWALMSNFFRATMTGVDPDLLERINIITEDSFLGVCDPEKYGFKITDNPKIGDFVYWKGGNDILSRLSRYASNSKYSHTGVMVSNSEVCHMTTSGSIIQSLPSGTYVFDIEVPDNYREEMAKKVIEFHKNVKGYGWRNAALVLIFSFSCLSRKSNIFHFIDTLSFGVPILFTIIWPLSAIWISFGALRVIANYGIQRPKVLT